MPNIFTSAKLRLDLLNYVSSRITRCASHASFIFFFRTSTTTNNSDYMQYQTLILSTRYTQQRSRHTYPPKKELPSLLIRVPSLAYKPSFHILDSIVLPLVPSFPGSVVGYTMNTQSMDLSPETEMMASPSQATEILAENNLFQYNRHNESIYDDMRYFPTLCATDESVVKFDDNNPTYINRGTLRALIVQMTSPEVIDYNLLCDFFLTYRTFSDSHTVMKLLLIRLTWAMQYINSGNEDTEKIGKLVLLRTFVVIRHWVLNYFIDDFEHDEKLCDLFLHSINSLTQQSNFISEDKFYEFKIITDLKVHFLTQVNEFFGQTILLEDKKEVYHTPLPLYADVNSKDLLKKSNTESSIHTNPSFRRLAMLSLYDLKVHHKCLVFEGNTNTSNTNTSSDENPQLSIQNLICHHKSSRLSLNDKLLEFRSARVRKIDRQVSRAKILRPLAPKTNYMNIKNSSLALKKTAKLNDKQVTTLNQNKLDVGFSTNGHIMLPTSRVTRIVPCSPVKKMEIELRDDCLGSPRKGAHGIPHSLFRTDSLVRKDSFKKVVDGWKKSFYSDSKSDSHFVFADEDQEEGESSRPAFDREALFDSATTNSGCDILSARIIDELEFLIRCYVNEAGSGHENAMKRATVAYSRLSKCNSNSNNNNNGNRKSSSGSVIFHNRESKSEAHLQNILEKHNNTKSFHDHMQEEQLSESEKHNMLSRISSSDFVRSSEQSQSRDSSFHGRVTSIDWNDEDLKFENSGDMTARDLTFLQPHTPGFDSPVTDNLVKKSSQSSGYHSSDLEKLNDDIHDLSIAMSPQSMKRQPVLLKVSHYPESQGFKSYSRYSMSSSLSHKHESLKSYMTYDSAFSFPVEGHEENFIGLSLKKKVGCHDFRQMLNDALPDAEIHPSMSAYSTVQSDLCDLQGIPMDPAISFEKGEKADRATYARQTSYISHRSRALSLRRSVRFSTLCALTELPFNHYDTSMSSYQKKAQLQLRLSDLATENSIFSQTVSLRNNSYKEECVSFDASSTTSATVPGINTHVLKELAAIPDESFSARNPIRSALYKLEGKNGLDSKTNYSLASQDSMGNINKNLAEVDSVPAAGSLQLVAELSINSESKQIMEEIENALTEDAIEYSSDIEQALASKPLTPIRPRPKTINVSLSTSNINSLLLGTAAENRSTSGFLNPKFVLDEYTILSDALKVESVMEQGTHIPFVLSYNSKSIAEHFTIIEKDMLQEIDWKELIELQWNKDLTPVNSWLEIIANDNYYNNNKGVNLVIARFNLMVNWIISEILLTKDEAQRIDVIARFIHTAYHCFVMQNFATLMQIILALTSERLNKLRSTWNKLAPGDILTLKNLEKIASPLKNFHNIRLCTNEIIPSRGCIPFVGLYLSDLVFNAERPKFAKATKPSVGANANSSHNDDSYGTVGEVSREGEQTLEDDRLINFSRFRTSVHIVKSLSQSIEWASQYDFFVDDELLRKCLYIKSLDEDEMKECVKIQVGDKIAD